MVNKAVYIQYLVVKFILIPEKKSLRCLHKPNELRDRAYEWTLFDNVQTNDFYILHRKRRTTIIFLVDLSALCGNSFPVDLWDGEGETELS